MNEAIIIITYHEYNALTKYHIERFQLFNPDFSVIPIKDSDFDKPPYWHYDWMWAYCDNIFYRWFLSDHKILSDRYFLFDYDTFCNENIKDFYHQVWDKQFACSEHFSIKQNPNWNWFNVYKDKLTEYTQYLYGIVPYSGIMIRHDDAKNLIEEQINNRIWANKISEIRLGTILNMQKVNISNINKNKKYITPFKQSVPLNYKYEPGIYHPVKTVTIA